MYFALESYIFWPCQVTVIKNTGLIPGLEKNVLAWKPLVQAPLKPESASVCCFWRLRAAAVTEVPVEPGHRRRGCDLHTRAQGNGAAQQTHTPLA